MVHRKSDYHHRQEDSNHCALVTVSYENTSRDWVLLIQVTLNVVCEEQTPAHILQTCPYLGTVPQQFWSEDTEIGKKL